MSRFWEIVFFLSLLFRRHVRLSELKHSTSRELPLTARKTVFSHLNYVKLGKDSGVIKTFVSVSGNLYNLENLFIAITLFFV